jgi:hypothetical protein
MKPLPGSSLSVSEVEYVWRALRRAQLHAKLQPLHVLANTALPQRPETKIFHELMSLDISLVEKLGYSSIDDSFSPWKPKVHFNSVRCPYCNTVIIPYDPPGLQSHVSTMRIPCNETEV